MQKVIFITGASSGIGLASLQQLVNEGHIVYGAGRKKADLEKIKNAGAKSINIEMMSYQSLATAVKTIIKAEGRIDVLFNNAGYGLYGAVEEVPIEAAKEQFEVNLFGLARLTQLVIPHMRKQKSGVIINTSSMGGKIYSPFGAWYHATKYALEGWSDCLRFELKPFGIKVVIIEPGLIRTPWSNVMQQNLQLYSGSGPYRHLVNKMAKRSGKTYTKSSASPPSVIAQLVSKAVNSTRPKTRYTGGKYAKLLIFIRTKFGDRVFDKIVERMVH